MYLHKTFTPTLRLIEKKYLLFQYYIIFKPIKSIIEIWNIVNGQAFMNKKKAMYYFWLI